MFSIFTIGIRWYLYMKAQDLKSVILLKETWRLSKVFTELCLYILIHLQVSIPAKCFIFFNSFIHCFSCNLSCQVSLHKFLTISTHISMLLSSRHSSMVSTAACYRGGPGFKWQGREIINFWSKRNSITHNV